MNRDWPCVHACGLSSINPKTYTLTSKPDCLQHIAKMAFAKQILRSTDHVSTKGCIWGHGFKGLGYIGVQGR